MSTKEVVEEGCQEGPRWKIVGKFPTFSGFLPTFPPKFSIFENVSNLFRTFFSKCFFVKEKINFFDGIFLKVHLLIEENRFKAISERFRQFIGKKTQGKIVLYRNYRICGGFGSHLRSDHDMQVSSNKI